MGATPGQILWMVLRQVVVLAAPPTTVFLHGTIRRRGAIGVCWLPDYYPQLIRAVWDPPPVLRRALRWLWDRNLQRWGHVEIGGVRSQIGDWSFPLAIEIDAVAPRTNVPGAALSTVLARPIAKLRSDPTAPPRAAKLRSDPTA